VSVLGVVAMAVKSIYKMARNIERLITTTEANAVRLVEIEKQVTLNGGASLKDAVARIEKKIVAMEGIPCPMHKVT